MRAGQVAIVNEQEDDKRVLDILELLLDISSHLQAMEHYIQTCEKAEKLTGKSTTTLSYDEAVPHRHADIPTSQTSRQLSPFFKEEGLSEEVRAMVARRLHIILVLTISTSENESDSKAKS